MINIFSVFSDWGVLLLRLMFAVVFIAHGWPKMKNLKGTGEWMASVGFKPGIFWAVIVGLTETVGAFMIAIGFGVHFVALAFVIDMIVATSFRIRSGDHFKGGYELDLTLMAVALFLVVNGGGLYALDHYWNLI